MRIGVKGLAAGALTLAAMALGTGGVAQAQTGPVLENGKTKAVYDYRAAIRERVFIPQPGIDQDGNGQMDWVTADIIRPSEGSARRAEIELGSAPDPQCPASLCAAWCRRVGRGRRRRRSICASTLRADLNRLARLSRHFRWHAVRSRGSDQCGECAHAAAGVDVSHRRVGTRQESVAAQQGVV